MTTNKRGGVKMTAKEIVKSIVEKTQNKGGIKQVYFIACGGSFASFYPSKYFLQSEAKNIRVEHYTSNEFVHATPKALGENSVAILVSHGGNTPETVEAAKLSQEKKAVTICLTHTENSPLTEYGDYNITYEFGNESDVLKQKTTIPLELSVEILNQTEGYDHYKEAIDGFNKINTITDKAKELTKNSAEAFGKNYKDEKMIYVMGSGAAYGETYAFSICILMEMQWVNSAAIHSGEYFHGPFEITDKESPFIMMMSEGRTRPLDERALNFLKRFGQKIEVIDAKECGLSAIDESVAEFFNPILFVNVMRVYAEQLAEQRNHPLSERRYMWKLEY